MAIDWNIFKINLLGYFSNNKNNRLSVNSGDISNKIADEYELSLLSGGDSNYGNVIASYNKPGLKNSIQNAFDQSMKVKDNNLLPTIFGTAFSTGVIQYWTGAQLGLMIPPPGSTTVVSNIVNIPGIPNTILNIQNTEKEDKFINAMIDFFKQHLQTISGTTISLVPATPTPVPTPFVWTGYI